MATYPRQVKVFAALLISMTACAMVLMALGHNPPSAGAFCLSAFYTFDPVERVISSTVNHISNHYNSVEICYYAAASQCGEHSDAKDRLKFDHDRRYHFIVGSLNRPGDGRIRSTESWKTQSTLLADPDDGASQQTIRICILYDEKADVPTDLQIIRTEALIAGLCRKFDIDPFDVHWPGN